MSKNKVYLTRKLSVYGSDWQVMEVNKMFFGYARVSTEDQNLDMQLDALNHYKVDKIYQEKLTGTNKDRFFCFLLFLRP
jgi:predicted site-specific integrase-resolvase